MMTHKGGSITTVSDGFILAGGEYKYGKNNWNMEIIKYQYSSDNLRRISKVTNFFFLLLNV